MFTILLTTLALSGSAPVPPTPAVDDGPCPAGTFASLPEFDTGTVDYVGSSNAWTVDGVVVGHSLEEDECIIPVDTKVSWIVGESHQVATEGETVAVILYGNEDQCSSLGGYWWYEACELEPIELSLPLTR